VKITDIRVDTLSIGPSFVRVETDEGLTGLSEVGWHDVALFRRQLDLTIKPKSILLICGASGSGKTTLVGLLPRFYDPDYGSVLIDGIDLRHAQLRSLRRQVGLVTQLAYLAIFLPLAWSRLQTKDITC